MTTTTHYSIAEFVVAISDSHHPLNNEPLRESTLKFIEDMYEIYGEKLTIVHNGDLCDFPQFSKYLVDPRDRAAKDLNGTLRAARFELSEISSVAPKARKCFKEGNHDNRIYTDILRKAPALIDLPELNLNHLYHLEKNGWEFFRTTDRLVLEGGLKITHGDRHSSAGSAYTAMAELRHGDSGLSMITGHIHTFAHVYTSDTFALVCGYMGSMEPGAFGYRGDRLTTCRPGFAVAKRIRMDERDNKGRFRGSKTKWIANTVEAFGPKHDTFHYQGKFYSA